MHQCTDLFTLCTAASLKFSRNSVGISDDYMIIYVAYGSQMTQDDNWFIAKCQRLSEKWLNSAWIVWWLSSRKRHHSLRSVFDDYSLSTSFGSYSEAKSRSQKGELPKSVNCCKKHFVSTVTVLICVYDLIMMFLLYKFEGITINMFFRCFRFEWGDTELRSSTRTLARHH